MVEKIIDGLFMALCRNVELAIADSDVALVNRLDGDEISELTAKCVEAVLLTLNQILDE